MGMLSGGRNYDDMDKFYDPCEDNRTDKQIQWEDGLYKQGGLRLKWAESFGRNDITKVGRKLATFLMAVLLWNMVDVIMPTGLAKMILQCMMITLTGFAEMWDYRGAKFTPLNWGYIVFLAVISSGFYSAFAYVFGDWGNSIFSAAYGFLYELTPVFGYSVKVIASVLALFAVFKQENENKCTIFAKVLFCVPIVISLLFFVAGLDSYNILTITVGIAVVVIAFLLWIKSKNKFIRNMTFVFTFYAMIEIIGYTGWLVESGTTI
jgi:hypothetical protein